MATEVPLCNSPVVVHVAGLPQVDHRAHAEQLPEEWVTRYIAALSQDIELAEIGEERGF